MPSMDTKNLEKSVKKIVDRWQGKVAGPLKDLSRIDQQLAKLAAKAERTPEEEKLVARCLKARKDLQKKVDKAAMELRLELALVTPPPDAPKSDIEKAVTKVKGVLKGVEKKLQLPGGTKVTPDVKFDFKKKKFEKLGIKLEWKF